MAPQDHTVCGQLVTKPAVLRMSVALHHVHLFAFGRLGSVIGIDLWTRAYSTDPRRPGSCLDRLHQVRMARRVSAVWSQASHDRCYDSTGAPFRRRGGTRG
jgi:hypothetical protein